MKDEVDEDKLELYDKYLYDLSEHIKAYEAGSSLSEHVLDTVPSLVRRV